MKSTFSLQLMAADEMAQYIPPDTMAAIKAKDEHPLFRAYCVGEEGEATPNVVSFGARVLNWMRSAISTMVQKLQFGTKIFHNHADTNAHEGRTVVGELVGKALEYVGEKMRAIAVVYIYPQFRDLIADAVSIEANVDLPPAGQSNTVAGVQVHDITGIAVGDRRINKPAFAAAGLVAQLQAFEIQGDNTGGQVPELTIDQVKTFLKNGQIAPSTVFEKTVLLSDQVVGDHVLSKLAQEYARRKGAEEKLETVEKEMPGKITKLETENKTLKQTIQNGRAQEIAKAIILERKMPEPKVKFVTLKLPGFKVEGDAVDDATIKGQLDKFVDKQLDEYTEMEKIINPQQQQPAAGKAGSGAGQKGGEQGAAGGEPNAGLAIDNV